MTTDTYWHDHRDELAAQISRLSGADALLILQALARCTSETQIAPTLIGMVAGTLGEQTNMESLWRSDSAKGDDEPASWDDRYLFGPYSEFSEDTR